MGQASHMAELRSMIKRAGKPPSVPGRQCSGTTSTVGRWEYQQVDTGRGYRTDDRSLPMVWVEGRTDPCRNPCSPWIPELAYCAAHLPMPLLAVSNERAELWAYLNEDIWEQVRAEHPIPKGWT